MSILDNTEALRELLVLANALPGSSPTPPSGGDDGSLKICVTLSPRDSIYDGETLHFDTYVWSPGTSDEGIFYNTEIEPVWDSSNERYIVPSAEVCTIEGLSEDDGVWITFTDNHAQMWGEYYSPYFDAVGCTASFEDEGNELDENWKVKVTNIAPGSSITINFRFTNG